MEQQIFNYLKQIKNTKVRCNYMPTWSNHVTRVKYLFVAYDDQLWTMYAEKLANYVTRSFDLIVRDIFGYKNFIYEDKKSTYAQPICCYLDTRSLKTKVHIKNSNVPTNNTEVKFYNFLNASSIKVYAQSSNIKTPTKKVYTVHKKNTWHEVSKGGYIDVNVNPKIVLDILHDTGYLSSNYGLLRYKKTITIERNGKKEKQTIFVKSNRYYYELTAEGLKHVSIKDQENQGYKFQVENAIKYAFNMVGSTYKGDILTTSKVTSAITYFMQVAQTEDNLKAFIPQQSGRRTYDLTNVSGYLKPFITDRNGLHFFEVDGKNTQPILLACILKSEGFNCPQYILDCEQGIFYEQVQQIFMHDSKFSKDVIDRPCTKQFCFQHIFFANFLTNDNKYILSKLQERYGSDFVKFIAKSQNSHVAKTEKLWYKLQSMESDIWNTLFDTFGEDTDYQIYDAIATTDQVRAKKIERGYIEYIFETYGINARANIELLKSKETKEIIPTLVLVPPSMTMQERIYYRELQEEKVMERAFQ